MEKLDRPFIDEWPTISFDIFENVEIENRVGSLCYKSFFKLFRFPEVAWKAFATLLSDEVA